MLEKAPCGLCETCEQCPHDDCVWDGISAAEWAEARNLDADARHANESKAAAQQRAYYEANREKVAAQRRAYYEANREKVAAQQRAYYEANREKINAYQRAYRAARKETL